MADTLTRFMPDIPLWWPCDNRISLLCLPRAALIPGDFSDKSFSLFKPRKKRNKLQHVIMLGVSGRALHCGVLGGTSTLVWSAGHPAVTLCEPPMPPSAHFGYSVTWKHSLSPLLHPKGACYWLSRTRCGEYREKDFSLCLSALVCIYVFMLLFLSVKITNELTIPSQN